MDFNKNFGALPALSTYFCKAGWNFSQAMKNGLVLYYETLSTPTGIFKSKIEREDNHVQR